uniref:Uncharacterized protein n=1 Tax=Aegilops tauschii subsp. strangulata TaxID=200361 RepID=A0A453B0M4_AEGTS
MADATAPRPLLRRVLSFREPLLLIPHLVVFLGTVASACAKCPYATSSAVCCED